MKIYSKILFLLLLVTSLSCERITCEYYLEKYKDEIQSKLSQCSGEGDCIVVVANCPLGCFYTINKIHEKRIEEMIKMLWQVCPPCKTECIFPYPEKAICVDGKCQIQISE